ncbi:hypothetical protein [Mesorhizobium temperatum]|uniref:Uncharacterized protein n=1 Tax=Mesorhizobium temperatum TaxID=241416 RepID=A0A271LHR0_9HYPH|nr:hypothetical protein [Mesorhizobium temperatum]PAQ07653.1 hypothetical protein CIT26_20230 [Mesorhizobium temperatum]
MVNKVARLDAPMGLRMNAPMALGSRLAGPAQDIALQQLDANLEWFEAWRDEHHKILRRIAQCPYRGEQVIAVRR